MQYVETGVVVTSIPIAPFNFSRWFKDEGCDWLFALIGGNGTNYKHSLCNLGGIRRHHKKNTASYTKLMHYSLVVMNSDGEMVIVNKCPLID
ncbi:hypothetical protein IFM89_025043 [Coptis chinensis]|uniref:Uncharacterized protein n=1 Tax=Coptis chinensis TaxID=261450 RepID=A0A835LJD7_9MAGN|nr:hypothetical protein IFM89_025043 [Coptis chinensis]